MSAPNHILADLCHKYGHFKVQNANVSLIKIMPKAVGSHMSGGCVHWLD